MTQYRFVIAACLLLAAAMPPAAAWWEASLPRHVLGQIPLLIAAGALAVPLTTRVVSPELKGEAAGAVLLAAFCLSFWMLPRWLDAAVDDVIIDLVKIVSLVVLAGLPLGWGWSRLGLVARGFVWLQAVGMLAILGFVYLTFPERLCNNYLVSEQAVLGALMLSLSGSLGFAIVVRVMIGFGGRNLT